MNNGEVILLGLFIAVMAYQFVTDMDAMKAKTIKRTNKPLWYPTQKKTKPDKYLLKSAVSEFLAKDGQIRKCAAGTKKP